MADEEDVYVPFTERKEWQDVQPIPQDDGPNPVCPIAYTEQFVDTMSIFRAILQKDERSERALALTAEVIQLNAANYTAWHFRRLILESLNADLHREMEFCYQKAIATPKNYQIWFHRRWLVDKLKDPSKELGFTAQVLIEDSKNYHAWSHRQWVLENFGIWNEELDYINTLLQQDLRNNSAWNQRYFVVSKTTKWTPEVVQREIEYAISKISQAPNNQSAWIYLTGVAKNTNDFSRVRQFAEEAKAKYPTTPHALSVLIDLLEKEGTPEAKQQASEYCDVLATRLDEIHKKYWTWRKSLLA
eukprot:TRINITY_DN1878_c0_g1_i1.p2 TRINITY_DN1878_c0_g1~~TRINITY_DN1878_c0_g1_i1.p2  ORF type:complete len:302 (-),score=81.24 TRINITY_DN1878_c0_g1_i1:104-1009(-)